MPAPGTSLLNYALLALLHGRPQSGYEVRKQFSTTPIGIFSDSPGSIYPALVRLEKKGWIRAMGESGANPRQRRRFELTRAGLAELKRWLLQPATPLEVTSSIEALWLRCAFFDEVLGVERTHRYLVDFERVLAAHVAGLRAYREQVRGRFTSSALLAFQSGVAGLEAGLRLVRRAISTYERGLR